KSTKAVILLVASTIAVTIGAPIQSPFIPKNELATIPEGLFLNGQLSSTGRITTDEYIQINGISIQGQDCTSDGLLGQNGHGGILICNEGVWTSPKSQTIIRENSSDSVDDYVHVIVECEPHEKVVTGGGGCFQSPFPALISSIPYGNGWRIDCSFPNKKKGQVSNVYAHCQS
ncbi:hypothetical protein BGZ49_004042, partial [Haplosporangium sp. Z 27]